MWIVYVKVHLPEYINYFKQQGFTVVLETKYSYHIDKATEEAEPGNKATIQSLDQYGWIIHIAGPINRPLADLDFKFI